MPLNLNKLEELLTEKGFLVSKYFIMDGLLFFVELISVKNFNTFLMYIPSKYKFKLSSGNNVYKLRYIDMRTNNNIADEYAGVNNMNIAEAYNDYIDLSPAKGEKLENHLEDNYKRDISLDSISVEDSTELKSVYRQMRRLRYSVQNIKYKIAMIFNNYLCVIRRDDSISCFNIKNYSRDNSKQMLIVTDLELFYEKSEKMDNDILTVRDSIYTILEKNQQMHTNVLSKLLESKKELLLIPSQMKHKKHRYDSYILRLENMVETLNNAEKDQIEKMHGLSNGDKTVVGMHTDIQNAHLKNQIENEISRINNIRQQVIKQLTFLRQKRENNIITIDKIMFDNSVMLDSIVKNFAKLKAYC